MSSSDASPAAHGDLAEILVRRSYLEAAREEDYFVLTSGRRSRTYFDCQVTTAFAQAMPLIAGFEPGAETEPVGGVGLC